MAYKSSTKQLTTNPKVFITIIKVAKVVQGNLSDIEITTVTGQIHGHPMINTF